MNDDQVLDGDEPALRLKLSSLRQEHQGLDASVRELEREPVPDQIQIARLKKRKLMLRDKIVQLEDHLTPDIIA